MVAMTSSGLSTWKPVVCLPMSPAVKVSLPVMVKDTFSVLTSSSWRRKRTCLRLSTISVMSSITPLMVLNSWSTPSMRTAGDGEAFERGEQDAAERVADGDAITGLKWTELEGAALVVGFDHRDLVGPLEF
jgi:hypothetical protein